MSLSQILPLAAFGGWFCLSLLIPWLRERSRARLFWALVVTGVPILGGLTLFWGPSAGVGAFALGLWLLFRGPAAPITRPRVSD